MNGPRVNSFMYFAHNVVIHKGAAFNEFKQQKARYHLELEYRIL